MLNNLFAGVFDTTMTSVIEPGTFLLCLISSLVIGIIIALFYMYKNRYNQGFVVTLATLPAIVCLVIMMVNGNVGTGVAVAGAFSLVRFRSAPGSAREIGAIFLAMGTGLVVGMGYIGYGFLCAILLGAANTLLNSFDWKSSKRSALYKTLHITIPENLDYTDVFDPILRNYTSSYELTRVRTTNMGSLFKLEYDLTLNPNAAEKEMIDQLRCRNGNLEISISRQENASTVL